MVSLTIQQKNLLQTLLHADAPVVVSQVAHQMNLTPRQVNYRLKPIKTWLAQHDATLKATPGIGITVECSPTQRINLLNELDTKTNFHLVLTSGQRQQLFAIHLLAADEPLILQELQNSTEVSRTTILKDLDQIEAWVKAFNLELIRRPNYGLFLKGAEFAQRQALTALLWGGTDFDDPLTSITYHTGLVSSLSNDGEHLPITKNFTAFLNKLQPQDALEWVTIAEAQQGGRFTDEAVLLLALAFSIQHYRLQMGHQVEIEAKRIEWLKGQSEWQAAVKVAEKLWDGLQIEPILSEIAIITMNLLAGLRDHVWPGDFKIDPTLADLITELMEEVAQAFTTPGLKQDGALRDGLIAHIIPAVMRQRFGLWAPSSWADEKLSRQYRQENRIAKELITIVADRTGVTLPQGDIDSLTLLIRAAFIRERPHQPKRVYIICSSGMATSQLLVARLKARFPSLEILGVLSLRELTTENVTNAHLLISTVPLVQPPKPGLPVIQVHPLLLPEDIQTITNWLT